MAIKIQFDNVGNPQVPTFVLATKSGKIFGMLDAYNISMSDGAIFELSFQVHKYSNGNKSNLWDEVIDFRHVWCREWDRWFEIKVETKESGDVVKTVTCTPVSEAELSQINIYDLQVNTESDIDRDDYSPTVLYDRDNVETSLLDRVLKKAPHYKIGHVDASIASVQRTFSFNDKSIRDVLLEIGQEINCLFEFDSSSNPDGTIKREINVYDLESYCVDCGHRGEFDNICPECGKTNILPGYGEDTTIFVSIDNLADDITYKVDVDSVKNCFRLEAGDDLMTATVRNCNPNGSSYIWYIPENIKADMSDELSGKISEYDSLYRYYDKEHSIEVPRELLTNYNSLVDKYNKFKDTLQKIKSPIVGYPNLMTAYYQTIDFYLMLHDNLMPNVELAKTSAIKEAAKVTNASMSPVAVQDIEKCSGATVTNAVTAMAKTIVNPNFKVKVKSSQYSNKVWTGVITITNYSDDADTADTSQLTININDNYELYVKQRIDKVLETKNDDATDIVSLFKLGLNDFKLELKKYAYVPLKTFSGCCQKCLDILVEQGVANDEAWADKSPNLYTKLYVPYYDKMNAINAELNVRESEIHSISGTYDKDGDLIKEGIQTFIDSQKNSIQDKLNFEKFLGTSLWYEFLAYRREDTYSNSNYISDGLDNKDLFNRALEFIDVARKDIFKSATLQHTISASLKNLLVMKEFSPITEHFEKWNWIRIKVDDQIYKLRIVSYGVDFDDLGSLSVTFSDVKTGKDGVSDVKSILDKAASIATSYDSVQRQASKGEKGNVLLQDWVSKGLDLTNVNIISDSDNQNITMDDNGLLCREFLPIDDSYDDKQLKLINRGLYLTTDNWKTSKAGVGDFSFFNPRTGKVENRYGIIADTLVGDFILSEDVGIYNENNSISLDKNGIVVTTDGTNETPQDAFTVQRKRKDADGRDVIDKIMYVNDKGEMVLHGSVKISSSSDPGTENNIDDLCKPGEDATVLRIDSSRGTVFKNSEVQTVLTVSIYHGSQRITTIKELKATYGSSARLEWQWQRLDEDRFGVISSSDKMISNDGFSLTLTPKDVDTKVTFMCNLITD